LKYQKKNIEQLNNILVTSYEKLTEKPFEIVDSLIKFLPDLKSINVNQEFSAHNFKNQKYMKIQNLNQEKIDSLSSYQIKEINTIFKKEVELLSFFEYNLIENF